MIALFCRIGFLDGQVNRKTKNMFRCLLALRQKKVPASLTWWHSVPKSLYFLHCGSVLTVERKSWTPTSSVSDEFEDECEGTCTRSRSFSHKVTTRSFGPQHPTLTPGAGSKTEVGRSIYRDRKPSQHVTVGLAWGSPQKSTVTRWSAAIDDLHRQAPSQPQRVKDLRGRVPVGRFFPLFLLALALCGRFTSADHLTVYFHVCCSLRVWMTGMFANLTILSYYY